MCALVAVDPDHSAAQVASEAMRTGDIAGPKSVAEAVFRAVGYGEGLGVVTEPQHGDERAEHLFLGNAVAVGLRLNDGRLHIAAFGERRILRRRATQKQLAALITGDVYVPYDTVAMLNTGQRTHLRPGVERIAETDRLRQDQESLDELVRDLLVEHQARAGDAGLALVVEDGEGGAVHRRRQIGVVKDDVGAFAAELELDLFQVAGGGRDYPLACGRGAREGNLGDLRVLRQVLACNVAEPWDDIDDALGNAHLRHQLRDSQRSEWGDLRRLHDNAVAGGERGSHLPAGEHQREVPGDDLSYYTQGLAQQIVEEARVYGNDAALDLVGHAAEVAEAQGRARHIQGLGVAQRMACIQGFQPRQLVGILFDLVGQLQEQAPPFARAQARPRRLRGGCCSDCSIDVLTPCHRDIGDGRIVVRIEGCERGPIGGIDESPANEQTVLEGVFGPHDLLRSRPCGAFWNRHFNTLSSAIRIVSFEPLV